MIVKNLKKFMSDSYANLDKLPFAYTSAPIVLDSICFFDEKDINSEVYMKDLYDSEHYAYLYAPQKIEKLENAIITLTTKEDIEVINEANIEILKKDYFETEYYYYIKNLLKNNKILRKSRQFIKNNKNHEISEVCSKKDIAELFENWKGERERPTFSDLDNDYFYYCLDNLEKYSVKSIYVRFEGKLIGFIWSVKLRENCYIGLHLKHNYKYKGLGEFLHYSRAQRLPDSAILCSGIACRDTGVANYKKSLKPDKVIDYYYVHTGIRNSKIP